MEEYVRITNRTSTSQVITQAPQFRGRAATLPPAVPAVNGHFMGD